MSRRDRSKGGGTRIPLLRSGFRPVGPYTVSFVYLHAGDAFAKRGEALMALAKVDVPVSLLEWELFLPEQYSAKPVGGNVIPARLVAAAMSEEGSPSAAAVSGAPIPSRATLSIIDSAAAGQIVGRVIDLIGDPLPGVTMTLTLDGRLLQRVTTNEKGMYNLRGVPSGSVTVTSDCRVHDRASHSLVRSAGATAGLSDVCRTAHGNGYRPVR